MKAIVNKEACIGCGLCEGLCPEVFCMSDDGLAEVYAEPDTPELKVSAQEAADSCPTNAIEIKE